MKKNKLNFIFFGTPDVASSTLEILKQGRFLPSLIVTSPDQKQGRKMILTPPPVKVWAEENNIPYIQPEKLNDLKINADLFIVVAYGKIMPEKLINLPKLGSINIHYSLLPKYRGASPVESAILNGDTETGVTIQQMAFKIDSGAILVQEKVDILPDEKAQDLRIRLIQIGGKLLVKSLPNIISQKITPTPQDEENSTHCGKIKKEDGLMDMKNESSADLYNKFRAYALWPRTFFFKNNKRIIITDATLDNGNFVIKKILPEGKKEIKYEEFLKQN